MLYVMSNEETIREPRAPEVVREFTLTFAPKFPHSAIVKWRGKALGMLQGVQVTIDPVTERAQIIALDGVEVEGVDLAERNAILDEMSAHGVEVVRNVFSFDEQRERQREELTRIRARVRKDPWRHGAAQMFGKGWDEVTKEERRAFKVAFFQVFDIKGPDIVKAMLEEAAVIARANPEAYEEALREMETFKTE